MSTAVKVAEEPAPVNRTAVSWDLFPKEMASPGEEMEAPWEGAGIFNGEAVISFARRADLFGSGFWPYIKGSTLVYQSPACYSAKP